MQGDAPFPAADGAGQDRVERVAEPPLSTVLLRPLVDVFVAPGRAFALVGRRPGTWWFPTLLLVALTAGALLLTFDRLIAPLIVERLQQAGGSPEDITRSLGLARSLSWLALLMVPLQIAAIGAIGHFVATLLFGGSGSFVQSLTVGAHAMLVGILDALVRLPLMLAKDSHEIYLGLALLLPAGLENTFVFRLFAQLDVFAIWKLLLVACGLAIVHRIAANRLLLVLGLLWLVWCAGQALVAGLGGGA